MNLAIIGCSGMGRIHAAMATLAGFKITVCVDTSKKAAHTLAEAYGARPLTNGAAAVARQDVDVVLIATPTHTHREYIEMAAAAGKHIFAEKPLCRTVADCKAVLAAVQRAGVKLFVGHVVRYFQEFEAMRAQVAAGKIGEPGFVKIYRGGIFPGGGSGWFADYDKSGGVAFDCMIHDLDWVRYAFGEPERIYGQALLRSKPEPMDYAQVTMRLKSGLIATFVGTWAHPTGFQVKAEICGSGGMIQYDSNQAPIRALQKSASVGPTMIVPASPVDKSPYQLEWEECRAWFEGGPVPRVTPEDGLRAVEMAAAVLKSATTGKPVKL